MDEQLLDLLYDAYSQGATDQDIDSLVQWYHEGAKPPGSKDMAPMGKQSNIQDLPKPNTQERPIESQYMMLPEGLRPSPAETAKEVESTNDFVGEDPIADYLGNTSLSKTIRSGLSDVLPQTYYSAQQRTASAKAEKANAATDPLKFAKENEIDFQRWVRDNKGLGTFSAFNFDEWQDSAPEFLQSQKGLTKRAAELEGKIQEQKNQAATRLKGVTTRLEDIKSAGDVASYIGHMMGQGIYQIPTSIATGGTASFLQESASIYDEQLDILAEKYGISREDVINQGLDAPAVGQAWAGLAGALDAVSAGEVFNLFRKSAGGKITKDILKNFLTEGTTETIQGNLERLASNEGAGEVFDPTTKENLLASANEFIGGGIGGASLGTIADMVTNNEPSKLVDPVTQIKASKKLEEASTKLQEKTKLNDKADEAIDAVTSELDEETQLVVSQDIDPLVNDIKSLLAEKEIDESTEEAAEIGNKQIEKDDEIQNERQKGIEEALLNKVEEPQESQVVEPVVATQEVESIQPIEEPIVEAPKKKRGRPVGSKATTPSVKLEETEEEKQSKIDDENIKLTERFNRLTELPRPSLRKQRIQDFIDRVIPKSKFPESHKELTSKAQKALDKEFGKKEEAIEEVESPIVDPIEESKIATVVTPRDVDIEAFNKKKEQRKKLDNLYTSIARAVDTNNQTVIESALKQANEYRAQEGLKPLTKERLIEKSQAEEYQRRKKLLLADAANKVKDTSTNREVLSKYGLDDSETSTTASKVLDTVIKNEGNKETKKFAEKLFERVSKFDVPVTAKAYKGKKNSDIQGHFENPIGKNSPSININPTLSTKGDDKFKHAVFHEVIHAATSGIIENPSTPVEKEFVNKVSSILKDLKKEFTSEDNSTYGLNNEHEFIAEFGSNPEFRDVVRSKQSLWKRVINAILEFFGLPDKYSKLMNEVIDTIDQADVLLREIDEAKNFARSKESPIAKAAQRIVDTAIARNYDSIAQVKALVSEVEDKVGKKFNAALKGSVTTRFKTFLNKKKFLDQSDHILSTLKQSERYDVSPAFQNVVDALANIDKTKLTPKEIEGFAGAVAGTMAGDIPSLRRAKKFAQKHEAIQSVAEITDKTKGVGFKDFDKGLRGILKNWVNFPTFISYISKYNKDKAPILMKNLHNSISDPYQTSQIALQKYMDELNKISVKNKLRTKNFNRAYFYGVIKRQGLENLEQEREYLENKLVAAERGYDKRFTPKEVQEQIADFDVISESMKEGKEPLTEQEMEYYTAAREILNNLELGVADNTEIVWEQDFKKEENYIPTLTLGSVPTDSGRPSNEMNIGQKDLVSVLNDQNFHNLKSIQNAFTYDKRGARGNYYDTNLHTVMARYLNATLFDLYGTYKIQKLNRMIHGSNRNSLDSELGIANMKVVQDALERAIKFALRPTPSYSEITKGIMKLKNIIQAGRIGTSGQILTQYFSMMPATLAATGAKPFAKALKYQASLLTNPEKRAEFENFIQLNTGELGIRDFFFEKYDSPEDVARQGFKGRLARTADNIEKKTVTWMLGKADKWAARLTWLAAFNEAGGDIDNNETWTKERLAAADLKTAQIQNVSSGLFAPKILYKDTESAALLATALWSFKSFALNSMTNVWLAAPSYFSSEQARKVTNAMIASAFGFEAASLLVKGGYAAVASLLTGSEPDDIEPKDEKDVAEIVTNSFYSLFFGGLPSVVDAITRMELNSWAFPFIFGEKQSKYGKTQIKYNAAEDSPLYGPKEIGGASSKSLGPFEQLVVSGIDAADLLSDLAKGKDVTDARKQNVAGKVIAEAVTLTSLIPFRGDIAKLIRSHTSEQKKRKRKRKQKRLI